MSTDRGPKRVAVRPGRRLGGERSWPLALAVTTLLCAGTPGCVDDACYLDSMCPETPTDTGTQSSPDSSSEADAAETPGDVAQEDGFATDQTASDANSGDEAAATVDDQDAAERDGASLDGVVGQGPSEAVPAASDASFEASANSPACACTGSTPYCNGGVCGVCPDGATQCSGNGVETCTSGAWGSPVACDPTMPSCIGGKCGQPPSCQPGGNGMTNCGSGNESCCASVNVTGGSYYRTYTNSVSGPTGQADPTTVGGFRLDKYLVTVGRFRQFVAAWNDGSGWVPSAGSGKHTHVNGGQGLADSAVSGAYETGWVASDDSNLAPTNSNLACGPYATWTPTVGPQENLPISCMDWFEAYAFCIWDGGFLPSEAEWEYAAAGGTEQRQYPWGSTDPGTLNQYAIYNCYYPSGTGTCTSVVNFAPVGTAAAGAGQWGQLDMAGEVWEWVLDWFNSTYGYSCTNCAYLTGAPQGSRVIRGGSLFSDASMLLPSYRSGGIPTFATQAQGFRCARMP